MFFQRLRAKGLHGQDHILRTAVFTGDYIVFHEVRLIELNLMFASGTGIQFGHCGEYTKRGVNKSNELSIVTNNGS